MAVRIKNVDTSALVKRFTAMSRRAKNFKPVLRWTFQELQKAHLANFAAQGTVAGAGWAPLSPAYASWKLANYGAQGILVRSGELRRSLTFDSARGAIRDIDNTDATFGTNISYAKFHQSGTRFMPDRKPVFLPELMAERTAMMVAEHIVYGSLGVVYSEALKGFTI